MRRKHTLHTLGIYDSAHVGSWLSLVRVCEPVGDPYDAGFNPTVDPRPYYAGHRRYTVVLRLGPVRFEIEAPRGLR